MSYILPQGYVPDAEFEDSYNERILREREPGMGDPYKGASGGVLDIEGEDLLALDMPGNRHSSSDVSITNTFIGM